MKDSWTEVKEISRSYTMPDGNVLKINNPSAVFISKSRTHYVSNEDDTARIIIPWPFNALTIEVEDSSDWLFPPPRFKNSSSPWTPPDFLKG
jgi:hypothetical protein